MIVDIKVFLKKGIAIKQHSIKPEKFFSYKLPKNQTPKFVKMKKQMDEKRQYNNKFLKFNL